MLEKLLHKPLICHRGASAYAPENTLFAFDKARELGGHFLEFDVMLSADNEPFVFHDFSLKRTTNGKGEFGLVSSEYILSLDAGRWFSKRFSGERIPHLRDVLEWLVAKEMHANIEIKPYPGATEKTTVAILACINRYWPADKPLPLLSSFDHQALTLCHAISPEMPLGLLIHKWDKTWLNKARELNCYSIHTYKRALNQDRIAEIKAEGYKLFVYTVNSRREAKKLLSLGVDAIFSDYPDLL